MSGIWNNGLDDDLADAVGGFAGSSVFNCCGFTWRELHKKIRFKN